MADHDGPLTRLVESVPNFSEGRRTDVVDRLATAVSSTPGVHLLDRTSDASHNRSVLTLAGAAGAVMDALEAAVAVAIDAIDMEQHSGEHPRIGSTDVVPFVPLADTSLDDCVVAAREFGSRIGRHFGIPVYLYAAAATRPERVKLADIRRGQYEGLHAEIAQRGREPDFGPRRMHPRAGAMAVGARPFLIAFNINLDSSDVDLAKRIARRIRESSGGLPKVQANGFWIKELGCAQVSMNLLDFTVTPMWRVWEAVREEASVDGVVAGESELIGLAPVAAFLDVADHLGYAATAPVEDRLVAGAAYLRLRDFSPLQALEIRLRKAQAEAAAAHEVRGASAPSEGPGTSASSMPSAASRPPEMSKPPEGSESLEGSKPPDTPQRPEAS